MRVGSGFLRLASGFWVSPGAVVATEVRIVMAWTVRCVMEEEEEEEEEEEDGMSEGVYTLFFQVWYVVMERLFLI